MKKAFLTSFRLGAAVLLIGLATACGRTEIPNEDQSNPSGNNNPSDDNEGNHANTPRQEPGAQYPGSGGKDSALLEKADTLHKP